jgi:hypothetical protein
MIMKSKEAATLAIVTVAVATLFASATIASFSNDVSAKKYGDSNAQTSAANNDCPAEVFSLILGIQLQASANCLNDLNMVQDSDGAAISSTPTNAAPNQDIELDLDLGGLLD